MYTHIMLGDKIFHGGPNISETYGPGVQILWGPNISYRPHQNYCDYLIKSGQKSHAMVVLCRNGITVI